MLLYWDQVSSIVPYQYLGHPEALGPYMQSLVAEGLVWQVIPGEHIYGIPHFEEAFINYLDGLYPEIGTQRRECFQAGTSSRIHAEKMGPIGANLCDRGLARLADYPWYDVEPDTADDFMSYLAAGLGQLDTVDSIPMTDTPGYLERLVHAGVHNESVDEQLESFRLEVLDNILPVPSHQVGATELRAFKDRRGQALGDFRRRVERELIELADIGDPELRQRRMEIFCGEARDKIEEIQAWIKESKWNGAMGKVCSVVAAIPGVPPVFSLLNTIREAVTGGHETIPSRDFAYAAYVQAELY
jgi:hypothetical protein